MPRSKSASSTEFELFVGAANMIKADFDEANKAWAGSPLKWILSLPSGAKGALGKRLVSQWCALKGLSVGRSPDSEADITVEGRRVEIKFSTLWKEGTYTFQQIRDQKYEYCICLGISPFQAHCWVVSKKILMQHVIGHMGQHTGSGAHETAWFGVRPESPPDWLASCGGSLDQAYNVLRRLRS